MTASYPTSVKIFSDAESYLDKIQTLQARMRETQEEITAIETALKGNTLFGVTALDNATLSISGGTLSGVTYGSTALRPELTWAGGNTDPDVSHMYMYYQNVGKFTFINATIKVTDKTNSNRTSVSFPIPDGMCGMDTVLFGAETVTSSTPIGVIALVTTADNKVTVTLSGAADTNGSIQIMGVVQQDAYVDPT